MLCPSWEYSSDSSVCLGCKKPWVSSPVPHKRDAAAQRYGTSSSGLVANPATPGTLRRGRQKDQKSQVILSYAVISKAMGYKRCCLKAHTKRSTQGDKQQAGRSFSETIPGIPFHCRAKRAEQRGSSPAVSRIPQLLRNRRTQPRNSGST